MPWPAFAAAAPDLAERGAVMLRTFTLGKGADLRRDPRYAVHAFPILVDGSFRDDEFAFGGRAVEMADRSLYDAVAAEHNDTIHEGDPMFRLDLSWAVHKRREPGRGAVYLRWRLESGPRDAATMAGR